MTSEFMTTWRMAQKKKEAKETKRKELNNVHVD